jgi:hypothetical protein
MASTRNKNTVNNYLLELNQSIQSQDYSLYKDYGQSQETCYAGNGVGNPQLPKTQLSANPVEIESFLFGIGTTDLTKPQPITLDADLKCLPSLGIYKNPTPVVAKPFVPKQTERPLRK